MRASGRTAPSRWTCNSIFGVDESVADMGAPDASKSGVCKDVCLREDAFAANRGLQALPLWSARDCPNVTAPNGSLPPRNTRDTLRAALAVEAEVADPRDLAGRAAPRFEVGAQCTDHRRSDAAVLQRGVGRHRTDPTEAVDRMTPETDGRALRVARRERRAEARPRGRARGPSRDRRVAANSCAPLPVSRSTTTPAGGMRRNAVSMAMLVPTQSRSNPHVSNSIPTRVFVTSTPGQR